MPTDRALHATIIEEVRRIVPLDPLEAEHRRDVLGWLEETSDVFRRVSSPVEPMRHLVSYFLVVDPDDGSVLLGDHVKARLWLPSGGHVEPGEHPGDTVIRECHEELGIDAMFHPEVGRHPLFLTVTDTVGSSDVHNDVSLWYVLRHSRETDLTVDPAEYRSIRWWYRDEIAAAEQTRFDPHTARMLRKLHDVESVARDKGISDAAAGERVSCRTTGPPGR
ncbi:NUDIX domain-containing protein [Tsukamurella sp. 8F]|uniref:NUDIX domain-containing protein n=1 Tax=unclassified Tsukamurella TaxID=2633480 RepID=UPI0023B912E8|nr:MULTISPECIES: NUDIX domain-containing protein [unclassified Tsukamurella]MDF0529631.1 NUDIX domain-containing protein [Tsukamurella sp. 8J]MDF0585916.1 NUDIX domain-containing protein [Tsukamurella sp. 8F]